MSPTKDARYIFLKTSFTLLVISRENPSRRENTTMIFLAYDLKKPHRAPEKITMRCLSNKKILIISLQLATPYPLLFLEWNKLACLNLQILMPLR